MVPAQHEQDGPGGNNSGLDDLVRLRGSCELGLGANEERGTFLRPWDQYSSFRHPFM